MKINFKINEGIQKLMFFSLIVLLSMIIIPIVVISKPKALVNDKKIEGADNQVNELPIVNKDEEKDEIIKILNQKIYIFKNY